MDYESVKVNDKITNYELDDKLGEGGFATVWKAKCRKTGRTVAIKKICKKKMQACKAKKRVEAEVAIHTRLHNNHVLELLDVFEDKDYVYMVLELCENGTIANYLKSHRCSESEVKRIFSEIVDGVLYLHSYNILHRDLTLGNILLTKNNEVKIADFGLATMLNRPDEKHLTMCGTPNFISPEVATRSSHGLEADVWSLGCMLYALLVGHPPFDTDTPRNTLTKVVMGEYKMPSHVSREAKDLVNKLLKKNPHDRIKLRDIPNHEFLKDQSFLEKWRFAKESDDSGMCTMTTEGTHSLHQSKVTETAPKRRTASATVASILNNPGLPYSHHNSQKYDHFDQRKTGSYSCNNKFYPKSMTLDSGEESEADEHLAMMHDRQQPIRHVRLRSRSEDRIHNIRPHGNGFLRSKLSGCETGEYSSLPSKHHHRHHHSDDKSCHPASPHKSFCHGKNHGISTCSADCTSDMINKPHHPLSISRRPASNCDLRLFDEVRPNICSTLNSLKNKVETVSLDDTCDDADPGLQNQKPLTSKANRGESCCRSQCSISCGSCRENTRKSLGRSASFSHLSQKRSHFSSGEAADSRDCSSKCSVPIVSTPTLDRRKSFDHQIKSSVKSSISIHEVHRMLFSQSKLTNNLDNSAGLRSQAPPLSTLRLLPTRHRTKNAVLSILESGEVVIEFLKKKHQSYEECVVDVCRISGDGLRIVLYQLNGGKGCPVKDKPPDLPEQGTDAIYSYESLPEKHWKKYKYAVRFVSLVRAKTPKVTLYSDKAKSHLMENFENPDFESSFYHGGKVSRSGEGLRLIDIEGNNYTIATHDQVRTFPDHAQLLWEHFVQCFQHCLMLEACLSHLSESCGYVFPVIVGRRPSVATPVLQGKENLDTGSVAFLPAPLISPNTPLLKSFEVSTITTTPQFSNLGQKSAVNGSCTPLSTRSRKHKSKHSDPVGGIRRVNVSGVGIATQFPSGEVRIEYKDGFKLTVHAANNGISFHQSDSTLLFRCDQNDPVPDWLRDRLVQVPRIIQKLMQAIPCSDSSLQHETYKLKVQSLR